MADTWRRTHERGTPDFAQTRLRAGEPEGTARRKRIARNTVYVDADRPSLVRLPILAI
jgi:hypothetical protein